MMIGRKQLLPEKSCRVLQLKRPGYKLYLSVLLFLILSLVESLSFYVLNVTYKYV